MGNFSEAWDITSAHEGRWTEYTSPQTLKWDGGNYFPFAKIRRENYVGTNHGFTAHFANNYISGWQNPTPSVLQNQMKVLSKDTVGNTFGATKWSWIQGSKINNQSIAELMFDFCVMADQRLMVDLATILGKPLSQVCTVKKITTRKTTDGYRVLSDAGVGFINNHPNPKALHAAIKSRYAAYHIKKKSPLSIRRRVASFYFDRTQTLTTRTDINYLIQENEGLRVVLITNNQKIETYIQQNVGSTPLSIFSFSTASGQETAQNFGIEGENDALIIMRDGIVTHILRGGDVTQKLTQSLKAAATANTEPRSALFEDFYISGSKKMLWIGAAVASAAAAGILFMRKKRR